MALAQSRFALSDDERRILSGILTYREIADPEASAAESSPEPTYQMSAQLLAWLCTDARATAQILHWGIRLVRTRVTGSLNLQFAQVPFPLVFRQCVFIEAVRLDCASIPYLDLSGSHLHGSQITDLTGEVVTAALEATHLCVQHHVLLSDGFRAEGMVSLLGAYIGGQLNCSGSTFLNLGWVLSSLWIASVTGLVRRLE